MNASLTLIREKSTMTSKSRIFVALLSCAWLLPVSPHEDADALGKVTFPTSCEPKVQALFERGVAQLHSFWFTTAGKTFESVLEQDSTCAIAAWGIAVNIAGNPLLGPPGPKESQAALVAIERGKAIGAKTQRERDWIGAIEAYYRDYDKVPPRQRVDAYLEAMRQLALKYPDDDEARIYYALALQVAALPSDKTYANQLKSAEILEGVFAKYPQHPGAAHYLIHAYDYPPLAEKGLDAANKYAAIAPAAPHARHMPSHIYSMLGRWDESIRSNLSSLTVQPEYYHALDFIVYARLQLGQYEKARSEIEAGLQLAARKPPTITGYLNAVAAMPARYAIERADWKAAAALPVTNLRWDYAESITRFARGLGLARSGDLAGAKSEIEALQGLQRDRAQAGDAYWADRIDEEIKAVTAWAAMGAGDRPRAETLMRAAADSEDASVKSVAMELRLYPMREMLAELLLEEGKADAALTEFEASARENPNRYRGLYGAARASEKAGKRDAARDYYRRLLALTEGADPGRAELKQAREYLDGR
jgi:hypothetical protein